MASISVFGLGYVGSVTATCFAHLGHHVIGVDVNPTKVQLLNAGKSPIVEPQVEELAADAFRAGRLSATTDIELAITNSDISFICVATPSQRNGKLDLSSIRLVVEQIGRVIRTKKEFHAVVIRSTVLPGTAESIVIPLLESVSGKAEGKEFAVCSNPEFMRESSAVYDFLHPPFTILGATDESKLANLKELYSFSSTPVFLTELRVSEAVKYVCNAFHALKVCFANEIGTLCQHLAVSPEKVMKIFASDCKLNISPAYLMPGFAFGGSCLPKDVRALTYRAKELDLRLPLMESLLPSNSEHVERAVQLVLATGKQKIGVLGLSFKAGTDDLRESPSVHVIKRLLGEGCQIRVWDDKVSMGRLVGSNRQFIEEFIPHIGSLLSENLEQVIASSEVIVVTTNAVDIAEVEAKRSPAQIVLNLAKLELAHPAAVSVAASEALL